MIAHLYSATLIGIDGQIIDVEVDFRNGMASFAIVGLPDKAVQEARERVISAIRSSNAEFKQRRIVVNLAPADLPKSGPAYDLPIALGYLAATNQIPKDFGGKLFLGELALSGQLRPVNGVLPIVDAARAQGFSEVYLPAENATEAAIIQGIAVYGVKNLTTLIKHLTSSCLKPTCYRPQHDQDRQFQIDLADIKGQVQAKKALEVSAAGGHNLLLCGSPGAGKTMLARALLSILPPLTFTEAITVSKIYSVAGLLPRHTPFIAARPFRAPHHTSSQIALVGGGTVPRPGEITLAHGGVLFLDELPEFSVMALEALRQPLEDRVVNIARAAGSSQFPANFMLIAAMNPCRCGYFGDTERQCVCTMRDIARYQRRISGPLLDRIDMQVNVSKLSPLELAKMAPVEASQEVRARVLSARARQATRYTGTVIGSNADLTTRDIHHYVPLSPECTKILTQASKRLQLSARSYYRLIKVARSIADLADSEPITANHLLEAISLRSGMDLFNGSN